MTNSKLIELKKKLIDNYNEKVSNKDFQKWILDKATDSGYNGTFLEEVCSELLSEWELVEVDLHERGKTDKINLRYRKEIIDEMVSRINEKLEKL